MSASQAQFALVALFLLGSGCKNKIGDLCRRSTDCSITADRLCDLSQPGGYCTIEGCSRDGCPKEAACVKVYGSDFLTVACDPAREDRQGGRDDCERNEVCLEEGVCADEVTARLSCRKTCDDDNDCRIPFYRCAKTGTNGTYLAPDPENPLDGSHEKICVPVG